MERKIKARFVTDFYGSAPALGAQGILETYIRDKNRDLLPFVEKIKGKAQATIDKAAEILSVFHRDEDGCPVLGPWMLKRCLVCTGTAIFNSAKNKSHPKRDIIKNFIIYVEPLPFISLFNGKMVKVPNGIKTYTVSIGNRSFFKAYEWIASGTIWEAKIGYDSNMIEAEHVETILNTAGRFGVGAFRERFGKFELMG